jgi:hypothetical protein
LDYVTMTPSTGKLINDAWKTLLKDPNGKAVW